MTKALQRRIRDARFSPVIKNHGRVGLNCAGPRSQPHASRTISLDSIFPLTSHIQLHFLIYWPHLRLGKIHLATASWALSPCFSMQRPTKPCSFVACRLKNPSGATFLSPPPVSSIFFRSNFAKGDQSVNQRAHEFLPHDELGYLPTPGQGEVAELLFPGHHFF